MARMRFTVEQRFADLDLLGHVNNVAYLTYLQEVRLKLLARLLGERLLTMSHVVVRNEVDYLLPLGFSPEPLPVDAWIERIGTSSYTIGSDVIGHDGRVAARGKTVLVHVGADGRSAPISDEVRELLTAAFEAPAS